MSTDLRPGRAVELESTGVVVVVDEARRVVHVSAGCEAFLGEPAADLGRRPFVDVAGADADGVLRKILDEGIERAGGWWPSELATGLRVKVRAFDAGAGLVGLDMLPVVAAGADAADAASIERVAGWNEWLLSCTSSAELLGAAASITRQRTGFDGVWVCRVEPGGHSVVVAAETESGGAELVGQAVIASDVPPGEPQVRGRAVPFFVSDLAAPGVPLVLGSPDLDLDGSALLRPYPEFLERLLSLGVRSTASLPIVVGGRLWGRVIAHHPAARRISAATQSELRLLGAATSARLTELIEQEDAREQVELGRFSLRLMSSIAASPDLVDGLTRDPVDLTGICAAGGAIVSIGGRTETCALDVREAEVEELLRIGRAALERAGEVRPGAAIASAVSLGEPPVRPQVAAGYVAVRLGQSTRDLVMWVRGESTRNLTWIEHEVVTDTIADELFTGVAQRKEKSNGSCAPWTAAQLAQADELRDAIGQVQTARFGHVQALNAELARSNDEYDAFAHAAAHDLKAPLRGIRQYVDFHLEDTGDRLTPEEQEQLHTVTRLADRMNGLLDSLLAYAQAGGSAAHPGAVSVPRAVDEAVELLGPSAAQINLRVEQAELVADADGLRQILFNLIGNAAKYSDGPVAVDLGVTTLADATEQSTPPSSVAGLPADTPVLTVRDDGIGIDPDHHERVFRIFHQLDPASEGTGAGLALCRRICRRRGGDIWLTSAPGQGTTFFVAPGT